jgi:hypothetical protein
MECVRMSVAAQEAGDASTTLNGEAVCTTRAISKSGFSKQVSVFRGGAFAAIRL